MTENDVLAISPFQQVYKIDSSKDTHTLRNIYVGVSYTKDNKSVSLVFQKRAGFTWRSFTLTYEMSFNPVYNSLRFSNPRVGAKQRTTFPVNITLSLGEASLLTYLQVTSVYKFLNIIPSE